MGPKVLFSAATLLGALGYVYYLTHRKDGFGHTEEENYYPPIALIFVAIITFLFASRSKPATGVQDFLQARVIDSYVAVTTNAVAGAADTLIAAMDAGQVFGAVLVPTPLQTSTTTENRTEIHTFMRNAIKTNPRRLQAIFAVPKPPLHLLKTQTQLDASIKAQAKVHIMQIVEKPVKEEGFSALLVREDEWVSGDNKKHSLLNAASLALFRQAPLLDVPVVIELKYGAPATAVKQAVQAISTLCAEYRNTAAVVVYKLASGGSGVDADSLKHLMVQLARFSNVSINIVIGSGPPVAPDDAARDDAVVALVNAFGAQRVAVGSGLNAAASASSTGIAVKLILQSLVDREKISKTDMRWLQSKTALRLFATGFSRAAKDMPMDIGSASAAGAHASATDESKKNR